MKTDLRSIAFAAWTVGAAAVCAAQQAPVTAPSEVPGVVIDHIPVSKGVYIGSPSIAVLPAGDYVASHDHFGPNSSEHTSALTAVFRSADRGKTWKKVSEVQGAFWSSLFVHRGSLYLLGPDRHHGNILIRRSTDGGETWTTPASSTTGVLRDNGEYHCAPMPVLEHAGRLWRGFEWRHPPVAWGINYRASMLSAPVDADLLDAASWTLAEPLPSDRSWNGGDMGAWLEGNAVVTPAGELVDILRVQTKSPDEKAAVVRVSADGKKMSFDPETEFVSFPGGAKKFAIRFDPQSKLYWSLALLCSADLRNWTVRTILLYHPDVRKHGFQYVDWLFEGDDIIAVCRTAYDDGQGGAHNAHDANYLTFHRVADFRRLTMADSVPLTTAGDVRKETADLVVTGSGFEIARLEEGGKAFSNRQYVWENVPHDFRGWSYTRTGGGEPAVITVRAKRDITLYVSTTPAQAKTMFGDADTSGATFHYTDKGKTAMSVFPRTLRSGQEMVVPQGNWTGGILIYPQ